MLKNEGHHNTVDEAEKTFLRLFREARNQSDRFLAVVFTVENGRVHMRRTTHDFPDGDWSRAMELMQEDAVQDLNRRDARPLETAAKFAVVDDAPVAEAGGTNE